jgi:hypothetical protein
VTRGFEKAKASNHKEILPLSQINQIKGWAVILSHVVWNIGFLVWFKHSRCTHTLYYLLIYFVHVRILNIRRLLKTNMV